MNRRVQTTQAPTYDPRDFLKRDQGGWELSARPVSFVGRVLWSIRKSLRFAKRGASPRTEADILQGIVLEVVAAKYEKKAASDDAGASARARAAAAKWLSRTGAARGRTRARESQPDPYSEPSPLVEPAPEIEDAIDAKRQAERVEAAMRTILLPTERAIIIGRLSEQPFSVLAEQLGTTEKNCQDLHRQARKRLAAALRAGA